MSLLFKSMIHTIRVNIEEYMLRKPYVIQHSKEFEGRRKITKL